MDNKTAIKAIAANSQMKPFLDLYVYMKQVLAMANMDNIDESMVIMSDHAKTQGLEIIKEIERLTDKPDWKFYAGQQSLEVIFLAEKPEDENGFGGCVSIDHFLINGNKTEIDADLEKTVTEYLESILFK